MRDLVAAGVALLLLLLAASLGTTLTVYRKRRRQNREHERSLGRTIIAEIPAEDDLVLFTEDERQFHYGSQSVDKNAIAAVRVLINGVPIAACVSKRHAGDVPIHPTRFDDRPDGIARDRSPARARPWPARPVGIRRERHGAPRRRACHPPG